jgi:hypothetical protein
VPGTPDIFNTPPSVDIPTAGKLFDDGTIVELIADETRPEGLTLLMWTGGKSIIAPRIVHDERAYVPLPLDPGVRRALRLPSRSCPIKSTADLFEELLAIMRNFTDLTEDVCFQLVGFVFASWRADSLEAPINLSLWSPVTPEAARVLLILSCLCRQAIALAGTNAQDLDRLPRELQATLLILRPASSRRTREILSTCNWRGFNTARGGQLGEFVGSVAVATNAPLRDPTLEPMLEIALPPSQRLLPILNARAQRKLANEYLPKLLEYRLLHHSAAVGSEFAGASYVGPASQLATGLHACFLDAPTIRDRQVRLLVEAGANGHETRRTDPRVPLVEALLLRCHEHGRNKLYVSDIATDMNAISCLDGDPPLSDRMVGSLLKALGFRTLKLDRQGRGIRLDPPTRKFIHDLARAHAVPSGEALFPDCAECAQGQSQET